MCHSSPQLSSNTYGCELGQANRDEDTSKMSPARIKKLSTKLNKKILAWITLGHVLKETFLKKLMMTAEALLLMTAENCSLVLVIDLQTEQQQ